MNPQCFDAEFSVEARCTVAEDLGGFDDDRARAAEGIEQGGRRRWPRWRLAVAGGWRRGMRVGWRHGRVACGGVGWRCVAAGRVCVQVGGAGGLHRPAPARQRQQAGGEVFLQRCRDAAVLVVAPAALEQRLAGEVEIELQPFGRQEGADAHVGMMGVDRWPAAVLVAEAVDDGVLDAQGGKVQAAQRRADRHHVDTDGLAGAEPVFPAGVAAELVQGAFVAAGPVQQPQQHAAGDAGLQVDAIGAFQRATAFDAAGYGAGVVCAQAEQFVGQRLFQPARAGAEEAEGAVGRGGRRVHGQGSRTGGREPVAMRAGLTGAVVR